MKKHLSFRPVLLSFLALTGLVPVIGQADFAAEGARSELFASLNRGMVVKMNRLEFADRRASCREVREILLDAGTPSISFRADDCAQIASTRGLHWRFFAEATLNDSLFVASDRVSMNLRTRTFSASADQSLMDAMNHCDRVSDDLRRLTSANDRVEIVVEPRCVNVDTRAVQLQTRVWATLR